MSKKIKVLVAESHPILLNNFCLLLEQETDIEVLAATKDVNEALELVGKIRPDVVVADISISPSSGNGADLMQRLKGCSYNTHVLAITQYDDAEYINKLMVAGASGLILKDSTIACLAGAIRTVGHGNTYLSPNIVANANDRYNLAS